jgi:hypothetical protein
MRAVNILKLNKSCARSASTAVVNYTSNINLKSGHDLTKKWMNRIQNKVKDTASQESFLKLSSLIDYYNKPVEAAKEVIQK